MPHLALPLSDPQTPMLVLHLQNGASPRNQVKIPALLDTGFNSYLTLPDSLVQRLNIKPIGETYIQIADGKQYIVPVGKVKLGLSNFNALFEVEAIFSEDQEVLLGTKALELIAKKFGIDFHKKELFFEGLNF